MARHRSFEARLAAKRHRLGPTELYVGQFLRDNREEVLVSSASALAARTGTSDATVIRTPRGDGLVVGHATPSGSAWPGAPAALCEVPPR